MSGRFFRAGLVTRFRRDRRGVVAPVFAISSFALVVIIGSSLDYTRLEKARGQLQAGSDNAALTLAMDRAARGVKDPDLANLAHKRVAATLPPELGEGLRFVDAEGAGTKVRVQARAAVQLGFGAILGRKEALVETVSTADFTASGRAPKMEIALVLGLTGGLNEAGRLPALQRAAQTYLDKAREAADGPDRIRIALVPYAEQVKLHVNFRNAPWLSFAGREEKPALTGQQQAKVQSDRMAALRLMLKAKQFEVERTGWNGCVSDVKDPTLLHFDAANQHPAALCQGPVWQATEQNAIQPLSSRFDQLRQRLGGMKAEGCENTGIGLVWGMGALLPQGPFGQAAPAGDPETRKVIVLVSGAPNAVNRQHGVCLANDQREPKLDATTRQICEKIKRSGVTIYTVAFAGGDRELLMGCASDGAKHHEAKAVGDIARIMELIAKETLSGAPKVARLIE